MCHIVPHHYLLPSTISRPPLVVETFYKLRFPFLLSQYSNPITMAERQSLSAYSPFPRRPMSTIIWGRVPQSRDALATGVGRPCPCPGPYLGRLCCLFKGMCLRRPQPHRLFAPPSHGRSARHTERGPEGSEGPATLSLSISRLKSAGTLVLGTLVLAFKVPPSLRRFQLSIYLFFRLSRLFFVGFNFPPSV